MGGRWLEAFRRNPGRPQMNNAGRESPSARLSSRGCVKATRKNLHHINASDLDRSQTKQPLQRVD